MKNYLAYKSWSFTTAPLCLAFIMMRPHLLIIHIDQEWCQICGTTFNMITFLITLLYSEINFFYEFSMAAMESPSSTIFFNLSYFFISDNFCFLDSRMLVHQIMALETELPISPLTEL